MTGEKYKISPDNESSLKKEKYFLKEEIIKKIESIAQTNGIESGDLQLESETEKYDSEGNLLYLSMQVTQERAREKKCGNIWYLYMIKGEHGPMGASEATLIMKADSTIETPNEVDWAEIVLEYKEAEDKWIKP
ncbi:MAG: hypothetical protein COU29_02840 [Candidatus Magasanikbacteria bacterium CG10_big_fil_rev_8_21_14_0_10_36_32]|uniref:Uncharacterized protein n=1 Tax=Candidatus Magasanikbacteria bacterium CG10_big_fil_rev_8_21_14_0_10_36_32 TaxID=1974646 RepID=A0A2M6W797_9BACT|nr:MAG: hypothetical protein COU29_02840 [Candidatus Magasanikbacteria bacterium CG10_big_fil_rev_8_21_14_0_10_36_32]